MIVRTLCIAITVASAGDVHAQAPPNSYDVAVAQIYPLPVNLTDEIRIASPGDALFVQSAELRDVAVLTTPAEDRQTIGQGDRNVYLPVGEALYRVSLRFRPQAKAYCDPKVALVPEVSGGTPAASRICLTDEDGDGTFETLWRMTIPTEHIVRNGVAAVDPPLRIGGGRMHALATISPPVRYKAAAPSAISPLSLGVEFAGVANENAYFSPIAVEANKSHVMIAGRSGIATGHSVIRVLGAEIEVISKNDYAISYRVNSAIPVGEAVSLAPLPPPAPTPPSRN